uniref:Reverse transcriptase domain-containing protein n=1 Tax=Amphilophus citrinellus TaxID=61819 RepID=A0A3Q0T717_AMPCI
MVRTLYANPTAIVSTNGLHSLPFPIERGSRQGCPLSPLLFALSLEPLAQAIRQNKVFNYPLKSCDNSISLIADDILLYISDLEDSIPKILQIFSIFGSISGYKINWEKSNMLKLNSIPVNGSINHPIPLQSKITYLGVTIHTSMKKIVQDNYETMLNNVQRDLKNWAALPASFRSRVAVVKMNILPRVNFLSAIPGISPDMLDFFFSFNPHKGCKAP